MSMQWHQGFDGRCCGLRPLIEDIATALRELGVPVTGRPDTGALDSPIVVS